jgi:hypothetical protein
LLVKGTATDNGRGNNGIASVTVNGVAAGGASVSAGTKAFWSASVTLTTGQNTITVIAKDALNNASQKSISVNCPFGKEIGSFNGVPAYSNGSVANDSQIRISTGLEWQCVEYVNRYYSVVYGMDLTAIRENAYQFFDNAALLGLQPFPNSGAVRPEIGDILCFKGGASGLGHVAIIREVGTNFVNAIQQNLKNDAKANSLKYNMSVNSGHYRISNATLGTNYICQGWLRKPAATGRLTITGIKRSQVENQGNLGALKQPWPAVAGPNQQQPLRLHFAGREGEPCALQTSTNLVDWQTVRTFVGTDSGVSFDEVFEPALGSHFYRVVAP